MDSDTVERVSPRRWVSLAATCTAAGLVWLAFADFAVAIPAVADEFGGRSVDAAVGQQRVQPGRGRAGDCSGQVR